MRFHLLRSAIWFWASSLVLLFDKQASFGSVAAVMPGSFLSDRLFLAGGWFVIGSSCLYAAFSYNVRVRLYVLACKMGWAAFYLVLLLLAAIITHGGWMLPVWFAWVFLDLVRTIEYYGVTPAQEQTLNQFLSGIRRRREELEANGHGVA